MSEGTSETIKTIALVSLIVESSGIPHSTPGYKDGISCEITASVDAKGVELDFNRIGD